MKMTKREVKSALNILTDAELARQFTPKIGRWAVGQWPDDKPIPTGRQWELRAKFPDIFTPAPEAHPPKRRTAAEGAAETVGAEIPALKEARNAA